MDGEWTLGSFCHSTIVIMRPILTTLSVQGQTVLIVVVNVLESTFLIRCIGRCQCKQSLGLFPPFLSFCEVETPFEQMHSRTISTPSVEEEMKGDGRNEERQDRLNPDASLPLYEFHLKC